MKVGDMVRVRATDPAPMRVPGVNPGDVGIVINCPPKYGDVVDIIVNGQEVRYWMGLLEVIPKQEEIKDEI